MRGTFSELPIIIGIAGGTFCGKTEIIGKIIEKVEKANTKKSDQSQIVHLEMQSFYKELNEDDKKLMVEGQYDFDHPDAIDFEKCASTLRKMMKGKSVEVAKYDMKTRSVVGYETIEKADVIIIEGILLFYDEKVRDCLSAKLFVDNDAEIRLNARLHKYFHEYKRQVTDIINQYTDYVKPAFDKYCLPTKMYADVQIPRGGKNDVVITMFATNLQELFRTLVVSSMSKASVLTEDNKSGKENSRRPARRPH